MDFSVEKFNEVKHDAEDFYSKMTRNQKTRHLTDPLMVLGCSLCITAREPKPSQAPSAL